METPADGDETKAVFFADYPRPDLVLQLMHHPTYKYAGELIRPTEVKGFLRYQVLRDGNARGGTLIMKYKPESQLRGWVLLLENDKQKDLAFSAVSYLPRHEVVDIVYWHRQSIKAHIHYDLPR
jgi:hypothetical protein